MRIGIFEGRKANYNRAVLKILIEKEPLKAWDIAKEIAKGCMDKTQDVYATLIRKNGRLNELLEKGYIKVLSNKCYTPSLKGIIAYLYMEKEPRISTSYRNILSITSQIPDQITMPFLGFKVSGEFVKNKIQNIEFTEEELLQFKSFIDESLSWIDLDKIHEEELLMLAVFRLMQKNEKLMEELTELFSKLGKF
jgi:DNA-binding PadR family transcriptional regulator